MDTLHRPGATVLADFRAEYNAESNRVQHVARNAITHASVSKVLVDPRKADRLHATFSDELDVDTKISDQQSSGRCWIFSFLNVLRAHFVHEYDLPADFEFSQAYLFFWDQFEKCNQFLRYIWELKDEPSDHPVVRELLKDPISDGGQWHMLQNLVAKYGVVPKHCMGESKQANATDKMTCMLAGKLREYAHHLRTRTIADGQLEDTLRPMLYTLYSILCVFLGEPPKTIQWEYNPSAENFVKRKFKKHYSKRKGQAKRKASAAPHNKATETTKGGAGAHRRKSASARASAQRSSSAQRAASSGPTEPYHIDKKPFEQSPEYTPLEFYKAFVKVPIDEYVTVIHYPHPDRPFHRRFQVKYLNNMVGGRESELHNLPIDEMKEIAVRSLDAGEPIWFCADIGKDTSIKYGILDPDTMDYRNVFKTEPHGWDKGLRMEYKDGTPSHAMALRGYHIDTPPAEEAAAKASKPKRKARASSKRATSRSRKQTPAARKKGGGGRAASITRKRAATPALRAPSRWLVENSWGEYAGKDGNLVMSDAWFDRHVYEIAVHKRHLLRAPDKKPVIKLEMWDVFGSLFTIH